MTSLKAADSLMFGSSVVDKLYLGSSVAWEPAPTAPPGYSYQDQFNGVLGSGWTRLGVDPAGESNVGGDFQTSFTAGQMYHRPLPADIAATDSFDVELQWDVVNTAGRMTGPMILSSAAHNVMYGVGATQYDNPVGVLATNISGGGYAGSFVAAGVAMDPVRLRIRKDGTQYSAAQSSDGGASWVNTGLLTWAFTPARVGIGSWTGDQTAKISDFTVKKRTPQRFYFPSTGVAVANVPFGSLWDSTPGNLRRPLVRTKTGSAIASSLVTESGNLATNDTLLGQWVSSESMIGGDIPAMGMRGVWRGQEASVNENAFLQVRVSVWSEDYAVELGVLYAGHTATAVSTVVGAYNQEIGASEVTRVFDVKTQALAGVPVDSRLVIEIGRRTTSTAVSSYQTRIHYGDPAAGDHPFAPETAGALAPWVEFDQPLIA